MSVFKATAVRAEQSSSSNSGGAQYLLYRAIAVDVIAASVAQQRWQNVEETPSSTPPLFLLNVGEILGVFFWHHYRVTDKAISQNNGCFA
jgi:hypothetical protein